MKISILSILSIVVISLTACSGNNESKENEAIKAKVPEHSDTSLSKTASAINLDTNSLSFLENASYGGMVEVESSSRILNKTESQVVKTFAQMMVKDHGDANNKLKALAQRKGYVLPISLPKNRVEMINRMDEFKEEGRNEYYVRLMINEHKNAIDVFTTGTRSEDADIKNFSSAMLPTLKQHYQHILKADTLIRAPKANQGDDPLKISDRYKTQKH